MNNKKYDIIVIGAGLGGLLTAAILAKEGKIILVLEKNKQIGGCLQSFGVDKKLFESAVHYMGSLDKGQTLYKIFNYLGLMSFLKLKKLDEDCFDEIQIDGISYQLAQGYQKFIDTLSLKFPHQRLALEKYINEIKNTCAHFPLYNMRMGSLEEKKEVSSFSLKQKLDEIFQDETLKKVLCGNNLLYAGTESQTPFYLHALIQNSYIESSWKFAEGSAQLAKLLQDIILLHGGDVFRNEEIVCIHEENGVVDYVKTRSGNSFQAGHYISNLHPAITYQLLDSKLVKTVTKKRIESMPATKSCFMVNISLKEKTVAFVNHNKYYHKTNDVWIDIQDNKQGHPDSYAYFFFQDKRNPTFSSALSILCFMDIEIFEEWEDTMHTTSHHNSRGAAYEAAKLKITHQIIEDSEVILPGLQKAILKVDACTPLSYRDYLNMPQGAIYGIRKDIDDLMNTTFATYTKVKNLFLTGQNINLHGVLGVSITAILTAGELVGLSNIVEKINAVNE